MSKCYFYKLTVDDGGAPCVEDGLLSLAICKPMIRSAAQVGDVIFGFAANSLHRDNRLIYIARITDKLEDGRYYQESRYLLRSDCIYEWRSGVFQPRPDAKFHGSQQHLAHDLGRPLHYARANVLLSTDYRYFGGSLPEHYKARFKNLAEVIASLGRGHRTHHSQVLCDELERLMQETWRRAPQGASPTQSPRYGVSHRGGGCGVVACNRGC